MGMSAAVSKIHRYSRPMVLKLVLWLVFSVVATSSHEDKTKDWPFGTKTISFSDQSPVNIDELVTETIKLDKLRFSDFALFERAKINITNTGTTVRITLADGATEMPSVTGGPLLDSEYTLEQMHFHWGEDDQGSEHEINGKRLAMEFHMVYYKKEHETFEKALNTLKGICVVGVLGEISAKDNNDLENFIGVLDDIIHADKFVIKDFKDEFGWLKDVLEETSKTYHTYHGSLTTPPFLGSVNWIISPKTIEISSKQLDQFRKLHACDDDTCILSNNRNLYKLDNRKLYKVVN